VFVPGKLFQPSLMFEGKAPKFQVLHFRVDPWPSLKHYTRLENLARDKYSSGLQKSVNYGRNKFYSTGPRAKIVMKKVL
jgi:hypothetical protein